MYTNVYAMSVSGYSFNLKGSNVYIVDDGMRKEKWYTTHHVYASVTRRVYGNQVFSEYC